MPLKIDGMMTLLHVALDRKILFNGIVTLLSSRRFETDVAIRALV